MYLPVEFISVFDFRYNFLFKYWFVYFVKALKSKKFVLMSEIKTPK